MGSMEFFQDHPVFSRREYLEFRARHGSSEHTCDNLLTKHLASGQIIRIKRGLFATAQKGEDRKNIQVDPYLLASKLTYDAVVSHHAALQFHGKSYSIWNRFYYLSVIQRRRFSFAGMEFVQVQLPASLEAFSAEIGGIIEKRYAGGTVKVTTLERTLVDIMYAPEKCGDWEEIWRSLEMIGFVDLDRVIEHTWQLGSAVCASRVGFFLEQHAEDFMVETEHLDALRKISSRHPCYLGSKRERGLFIREWNLVVPDRVIRRSWGEVL